MYSLTVCSSFLLNSVISRSFSVADVCFYFVKNVSCLYGIRCFYLTTRRQKHYISYYVEKNNYIYKFTDRLRKMHLE